MIGVLSYRLKVAQQTLLRRTNIGRCSHKKAGNAAFIITASLVDNAAGITAAQPHQHRTVTAHGCENGIQHCLLFTIIQGASFASGTANYQTVDTLSDKVRS
jgi:hypothetical protein